MTFLDTIKNEIIENKSIDSFYVTTIINSYRFSFKFGYNKLRIKNKIIEIINNENYYVIDVNKILFSQFGANKNLPSVEEGIGRITISAFSIFLRASSSFSSVFIKIPSADLPADVNKLNKCC